MTITLDIFNNDAFGVIEMLEPVKKMPTLPTFLESLNMFESEPVSQNVVGIGMEEGRLALIQTTQRAAPIEVAEPDLKNVRHFGIPRLAKGDKIRSHELQGMVPTAGATEVETVQTVLARKQQKLKQDVRYTWGHHMLGAVQAKLLDADGSVIYDYYDEWDIDEPDALELNLVTANDGDLRQAITANIHRPLTRTAKTGGNVQRVIGLAGDNFWDALIKNPEVRDTYKGWSAAADLRDATPFETFRYGSVDWINFQGSDNEDIRVGDDDAVIFPVGVPGMFRHVKGPGESLELVNQLGQDEYPLLVWDKDRNMWVQPEIYSYPLFLNTRPDLVIPVTIGN